MVGGSGAFLITVAGGGCGSAGTMTTAGGPLALGNSAFRLELIGAPAGSVAFADIGVPGNEIVCGSCTITNGLVIVPVAPAGGVFRFGLALPCEPLFVGATLSAQWLVFSGTAAPCPPVRGLSASSRLHWTIGE